MTHSATAEYKKPKNVRNDAPNSQSTSATAVRGICDSAAKDPKTNSPTLTTLAPYGHVGQSTPDNATFTWYVADRQAYPVAFSLYEFDAAGNRSKGNKVYQTQLISSPGIMTHSLPAPVSLIPEKNYIWQVALICNPNSPSQALVTSNQVKIVEDNAAISSLDSAVDAVERANIYATSGFWYDAIAEVSASPNDPQTQDATVELISQLSAMEVNNKNLQQILDSLQQSELGNE